jgi:hypothetical protein
LLIFSMAYWRIDRGGPQSSFQCYPSDFSGQEC